MRVEQERQPLLDGAQAVLKVVSSRASLPVLGGIRLRAEGKKLQLASTDLEVFISTEQECNVVEEGVCVLPGRLLGDILRSLPAGKVLIEGADQQARIESARTEFQVKGFNPSDFPKLPESPATEPAEVLAGELGRAVAQVVRAASVDEARPVLTGVLWSTEGETLRLVATDSYRLAVKQLDAKKCPPGVQAIIPGRVLGELSRLLASEKDECVVKVWLGDNQAVFETPSMRLVTRLIDGEFPNWQKLLPDGYQNKLRVDREKFGDSVERVALVAQVNTPVKFELDNEVKLTATEAGVADAMESLEDASYDGQPMTIAFNPKFFRDGLDAIQSENVVLEAGDPLKPATLKPDGDESFTYLLMPIRLGQ